MHIRRQANWLTRTKYGRVQDSYILQRCDRSDDASAHVRPVWCAYCVESIEWVLRNLEIPKTLGDPSFLSCIDLGNEFLSLLVPAALLWSSNQRWFSQIDSHSDHQMQMYFSFAIRHYYYLWKSIVVQRQFCSLINT